MQIPLTRIEYDYIIKTFYAERPKLFLQFEEELHPVERDVYCIENGRIYFTSEKDFPLTRLTLYFDHRQRTICFFAVLKQENDWYYLEIPSIAYKHNSVVKEKEKISVTIHTETENLVTAYEHLQYPLDFAGSSTTAENNAENTGVLIEQQPRPLFRSRINEFEKNIPAFVNEPNQSENYFLFIDNSYLVCTCAKTTAALIETHTDTELQFTINFPTRTVHTMQSRLYLSRAVPNSEINLLCFSIKFQHEEDRRFLYERVHHKKYSPSPKKFQDLF